MLLATVYLENNSKNFFLFACVELLLCIFKTITPRAAGCRSNGKMVSEGIKPLFIFGRILMLWFTYRFFSGGGRAGCVSEAVHVLAKLQELQSEAPSASHLFPSKRPASISHFVPALTRGRLPEDLFSSMGNFIEVRIFLKCS